MPPTEVGGGSLIHSDYYDKRKKRRIDKVAAKDLESAQAAVKKLFATAYYCRKDAEVAKEKAKAPGYHKLDIAIKEKKIYKKGRPKGGIKEVADTRYILDCSISPDEDMIENLRQEAGCFVMITNLDDYSPAESLLIWRLAERCMRNYIRDKNTTITG